MEKLIRRDDFAVELLPTGLFAGDGAFAMNDGFAAHAWQADRRIACLSGQPFSSAYRVNVLGSRKARVDSGPATLALTAVALSAPSREFEALTAIQTARYVDGRDSADMAVVAEVLRDLGLQEPAECTLAPDDALLAACRHRIETARADMRRFNANGVPALIVGDGDNRRLLQGSALFGSLDVLLSDLKAA